MLTLPQILSILRFYNDEQLIQNGISLSYLSRMNQQDSQEMAKFAGESHKESRTMRIASIIAVLYLPANLVIVCDHFLTARL